jgi:hypothetical protein
MPEQPPSLTPSRTCTKPPSRSIPVMRSIALSEMETTLAASTGVADDSSALRCSKFLLSGVKPTPPPTRNDKKVARANAKVSRAMLASTVAPN